MKKAIFLFSWCFLLMTTAVVEAKNAQPKSQSNQNEPSWSLIMEKGGVQLFYSQNQDGSEMLKAVNTGTQAINVLILIDSGVQTDISGNEIRDNKEFSALIDPTMSKEFRVEGMTYSISDCNIQLQIQ